MKKKNITKLTILMMCLPYFTAIPKNVFAEETESSFEATETSEEKTQLSEEQIQQIEEEFSVPTLKKNRKKEVIEETTFEAEEDTNQEQLIEPTEFNATPRGTTITVTSPILWLPLGATEDVLNTAYLNQGRIEIDGKQVGAGQVWMFSYLNGDTDTFDGSDDIERFYSSSISDKSNDNNKTIAKENYKLNYGNSLVFESGGKISGAFTHNVKTYPSQENYYDVEIVANSARGSRNDVINSAYGDKEYFKIEAFSSLGNFENPSKSVVAKGNDKKGDVLNRWGRYRVSEGTIIRTWSAEPNDSKFYISNGSSTQTYKYANNDGYALYRVTKTGLEPILLTPLKVKPQTITTNTTDLELNSMLDDLFEDIPEGVTVDKFIEYPERKKPGKSKGKVQVTEKSSTTQNKEVRETYEIPFDVIEVPLEVEIKEVDLLLGQDASNINPKDFIESVQYKGQMLNKDEYTATFEEEPYTKIVGTDDEAEIEITINSDSSISTTVFPKPNVRWGNTIASRNEINQYSEMMTSISLLEDNQNPILKMTYGDGHNNRTRSGNELQIYRKDNTNILFSEKENASWSYQSDSIDKWQPKLDKIDFEYGDVLKQTIYDYRGTNFKGTNTYMSRSDELVKETEGYEDAYYELTKDGYNLLQLNQITTRNNVLVFDEGDSSEKINEQAINAIEFPNHITNKEKYRFELSEVDTSNPGKRKAKMNIYEKLASGGEFMISKSVDYVVNETPISVELKEVEIPVGTKLEFLDPNSYVKKVVKNGKELNASEYTASFKKAPTTSKVGKSETTIKIITKEDNKSIVEKTNTKILWGDTVGSSLDGTSKTPIDASISMLHDGKKPYLVANEGTGLAVNASSGTYINVYQNSEDNAGRIFYVNPYYPKGDARKTMEVFNKAFDEQEFNYGDVIVYETRNEEEVGLKLWASRNEELIKESVGYNKSFYEMTKDGYRLMRANEIALNDKIITVPFNTKHDEMNKKAIETVILPEGSTASDFRFEFASVDTASSGKKKTKLNIYEKLASGKEFKTTVDVEYIVNAQVTEKFYDEAGKEIKTAKRTNFDFGKTYTPKPDSYISSGDELYNYKGWLKENEKPGTDTPRNGIPEETAKEATFHYIYEKSDKHINMTIPTEMIFGTENGKDVTSVDYEIKNNSNKVKTAISLNEFKKETSEVKLLTSKEKDPTKTAQSARLNLTTNGQTTVGSLNDTTKNETITTLNPGEKASMGISGKYFGSQKESARIKYNMMLKFTVVPD
ncbi:hypothetical protein [uncultured Vagococcus sp.]|uniref:hypothetical protein n=1 Tax=uncultured Vagococcus sp. TaxID=189676 RepID=UPI0025868014|nr:hypothetical protein [uncultured Vagococcus sp.]